MLPTGARDSLLLRRAYVSISLTNKVATSRLRLLRVFEWARSHFESFDVLLGDYFHRHNLADLLSVPTEQALEVARVNGNETANLAQDILKALELPHILILRAEHFSQHPDFVLKTAEFGNLYLTHEPFRRLIDTATDTFLLRFAPSRLKSFEARLHSRNYQLEELAVFELLARDGYSVNIYPGNHLPAMRALVTGQLVGVTSTLREMVLVELKVRGIS